MRLLLHTRVLLWALTQPDRLPAAARAALEEPDNAVLFSAASVWEIAIACAPDRPNFRHPDLVLRRYANRRVVRPT